MNRSDTISHLQIISTWASFAKERDLNLFTEKHLEKMIAWTDDAISLLKKQGEPEAVQSWTDAEGLPRCGACESIQTYGCNFCSNCGKPLTWRD